MIIATGCYIKHNGDFIMHSPKFTYMTKRYVMYSYKEMQKKYREDNNLKGKHIEWLILGWEDQK